MAPTNENNRKRKRTTSNNETTSKKRTTTLNSSIRVGNEYQAEIPEIQKTQLSKNTEEKSSRVWLPTEDSIELDEYIDFAKTKHNYSEEQALAMAFFHRYDYEKAKQDLANYAPVLEEWTKKDIADFRRGLKLYRGNFKKIQKMLPHKKIGSIASEEQALAMAFFHRYDYEKAKQDLANYAPVLEEWTKKDIADFRRGLKLYRGNFKKIQKMLPHKK
ncbi:unnamed protein product [Brassicogethes aeneus]|uniref:ELM2 domain-containing protein n=1 Tax=Brassicogethes aeneus TaxID=1431903 RepID=A0A9P0ANQ5_BRAAE|nr:unnamed protein product [Brassicogethes aeneus]